MTDILAGSITTMNEFTMFTINLLFIYSQRRVLFVAIRSLARPFVCLKISTENQTTRIIMYWRQIIIFAIEISLSAICKISSLFSSRKYIMDSPSNYRCWVSVESWQRCRNSADSSAWKHKNLTFPSFARSLLFSVLYVCSVLTTQNTAKLERWISTSSNLPINNLEYNFYSSDLSRAIAPKKNTQNRKLISSAPISLKWKILIYFRFR